MDVMTSHCLSKYSAGWSQQPVMAVLDSQSLLAPAQTFEHILQKRQASSLLLRTRSKHGWNSQHELTSTFLFPSVKLKTKTTKTCHILCLIFYCLG
jgi:hypothetical protein